MLDVRLPSGYLINVMRNAQILSERALLVSMYLDQASLGFNHVVEASHHLRVAGSDGATRAAFLLSCVSDVKTRSIGSNHAPPP